ncbi:PilW family protein [Sphingobacterium siyangense]|uniref:PilW family protein n=1 Tax=Sphingobacterium siyangense TaxID=459529 RepID=UPI003DA50E79
MGVNILRLKASSLVETLVSMVIILIVFGIGMLIFVNLTKASRSETRKSTTEQMMLWSRQLETTGFDGNSMGESLKDSTKLSYQLKETEGYADRLRLAVYAISEEGKVTDSLVRYIENKAEERDQQ